MDQKIETKVEKKFWRVKTKTWMKIGIGALVVLGIAGIVMWKKRSAGAGTAETVEVEETPLVEEKVVNTNTTSVPPYRDRFDRRGGRQWNNNNNNN